GTRASPVAPQRHWLRSDEPPSARLQARGRSPNPRTRTDASGHLPTTAPARQPGVNRSACFALTPLTGAGAPRRRFDAGGASSEGRGAHATALRLEGEGDHQPVAGATRPDGHHGPARAGGPGRHERTIEGLQRTLAGV